MNTGRAYLARANAAGALLRGLRTYAVVLREIYWLRTLSAGLQASSLTEMHNYN
jgi:hypothetical protein